MAKSFALLIHSLDTSFATVSKLLEARDFSIHVSRSLDEAERVLTAFPQDQMKFVFADVSICHGQAWSRLLEKVRSNSTDLALVCYHPEHAQALYNLLGHNTQIASDLPSTQAVKPPPMIGETPVFHEVLNLANRYGAHDITVLITGETGTGKEIMAQYIHSQGGRADKPFVAVNCAAIVGNGNVIPRA